MPFARNIASAVENHSSGAASENYTKRNFTEFATGVGCCAVPTVSGIVINNFFFSKKLRKSNKNNQLRHEFSSMKISSQSPLAAIDIYWYES